MINLLTPVVTQSLKGNRSSTAILPARPNTIAWFTKTAWIGTGVRDRNTANAEHIKATLARLKEKAEAG